MRGGKLRSVTSGLLLLLLMLAAAASAAGAEEPAPATAADSIPRYVLPPIPVTAEAWDGVPDGATRSVLGRSALARTGVLRLADALGPVPGLRVVRTGAPGSYAALSIRGSSNEQVLVLVDGRRLTAAQGGGVDLGGIDVATLERVEIVRGAASAIYGTDAIGGVVNLVTRPAATAPAITTGRLEVGSFATAALALRHEQGAGERRNLWVRAHGLRSDGAYAYRDRRGERERTNADVEGAGLGLGGRMMAGERTELMFDGGLDGGEEGVPGPSEFPTPEARRDDRSSSLTAELRRLPPRGGDGHELVAAAFGRRQRRSYVDPEAGIADRHVNVTAGVDLRVASADGWAGGAELRHHALDSTTDGERARRAAGLHGRGAIAVRPELTLAPAARLDLTSDAKPLLGGRLAAQLSLPGRRNLRIAAGNAYRLPSFDDLFAPDRAGAVGNPALRPEHAFELEVGFDTPLRLPGAPAGPEGGAELAVTGHARGIRDLIQWMPGPDGRYRPHNIELATMRGLELELRAPFRAPVLPGPLAVGAALTLLDARNRSGEPLVDGRRLVYRPAVTGHADLRMPLSRRLAFLARLEAIGSTFTTAANTKRLPGYALVDVTLERTFGDRFAGSLAVLNVGDVEAVDIRDYPLPGREWRLGLRFQRPGLP